MGSGAEVRGRSFSGLDDEGTKTGRLGGQPSQGAPDVSVSSPDGWKEDIVGDLTLNELAERITDWRAAKGFPCPTDHSDPDLVFIKLGLVISECVEAQEATRAKVVDEDNFREEIADAFIRLFDLSGSMGIDLTYEIAAKMQTNCGRPHMHGKRL